MPYQRKWVVIPFLHRAGFGLGGGVGEWERVKLRRRTYRTYKGVEGEEGEKKRGCFQVEISR